MKNIQGAPELTCNTFFYVTPENHNYAIFTTQKLCVLQNNDKRTLKYALQKANIILYDKISKNLTWRTLLRCSRVFGIALL